MCLFLLFFFFVVGGCCLPGSPIVRFSYGVQLHLSFISFLHIYLVHNMHTHTYRERERERKQDQ